MEFINAFQVIFLIMVIGCSLGNESHNTYGEELDIEKLYVVSDIYISCSCNGKTKKEEMNTVDALRLRQNFHMVQYCGMDLPKEDQELCLLYKECGNCTIHASYCERNTLNCYKKDITLSRKTAGTPIGSVNGVEVRRTARQLDKCSYPMERLTYDLHCVKHYNYIDCTQKCIYGHTLKEGITKNMTCKYSENTWKPSGFKECDPFVDCTMKLIKPGKLRCSKPTLLEAPVCRVTCYSDEKFLEVSGEYTCKISGGWTGKLPHCVADGTALVLAPAPREKLHFTNDLKETGVTK